jgi:GDP-4-dehydro-6-deoxy-D-mannose reductase
MPTGPTIITGAAGFAGTHLLDRLAGEGTLVGWDHPDKTSGRTLTGGLEWRGVDLLDRDAVRAGLEAARPSRLYHLAGVPHVGDSWRSPLGPLLVHVRGTHHILEAIRDVAPSCRVLVVSSGLVYRNSELPLDEDAVLASSSPYGLSKIAQDQLTLAAAREDGIDAVVARPFNHTGPGQDPAFAVPGFARQIARIEHGLAPPEIAVGNLDARRDVTDVRDVASAYEAIMRAPVSGCALNVCTGTAYRIGDLLDRLIALSTVRVTVRVDPERLRPSDVPVVCGNPARVHAACGWTPTIGLDRLLADVLDFWRHKTTRET